MHTHYYRTSSISNQIEKLEFSDPKPFNNERALDIINSWNKLSVSQRSDNQTILYHYWID